MYYSYYGFGYMQNWAANTVLRMITDIPDARIAVVTSPMAIPSILKDTFCFLLGMVGPYFYMMVYIPMLFRTSYHIISEKELRVRETMRMMGMRDTPYWLSWLLYHTIINTVISIPIWLFSAYGIFSFSSSGLFFVYIWLYG
jgi:hypothetical protein